MAKHSALVGQFKDMTENFDFKNEEHRTMVILTILLIINYRWFNLFILYVILIIIYYYAYFFYYYF